MDYSRSGKYNQNVYKNTGTKFRMSSLKNMIETSSFFLCTHICKENIWEKIV
jgi:hypothetical protein